MFGQRFALLKRAAHRRGPPASTRSTPLGHCPESVRGTHRLPTDPKVARVSLDRLPAETPSALIGRGSAPGVTREPPADRPRRIASFTSAANGLPLLRANASSAPARSSSMVSVMRMGVSQNPRATSSPPATVAGHACSAGVWAWSGPRVPSVAGRGSTRERRSTPSSRRRALRRRWRCRAVRQRR